MKYYLFLIFSFGVLKFTFDNLYMIGILLMFLMILNCNMNFGMWMEIYSIFSYDFYSFYLIILSIFIISIVFLMKMEKLTKIYILVLLVILVMSFSTFNLLMFYFLFEISLLPIFMLILYNGYTFERFEASLYMFFFTMISSVPFLIILLNIMKCTGSLMFSVLEFTEVKLWAVSFLIMMMVFLVKMPAFFIHIWLPKAHVEAPVYGSMILAGILLKLGSYGILRMYQIFFLNAISLSNYLISFSLIGGLVMSFVCLVQTDMKMLVAYSSVVHMSLLIASMSTLSSIGFIGSYLMMIGHGLCSSGLFFIVNVSYSRMGSRLLYFNKGMVNLDPTLSMWWFLMCISNFSAPLTLSLIAEILMMSSLISFDKMLMLYMMMTCFLSSAYSLYFFSYSQHGESNFMSMKFGKVEVLEYLILFIHWFILNVLIFSLNLFMI
uniref:NADH-ubiquinone oxidoreductase chain 4 n=2 Tax=Antodynerus TaxID=2612822 RepID=A0A6M9ATI5_9HYME|nr:NADH dehydrogenase subunit 4 [Antodynerus aff. limbatus YN]QKK69241.1 NADH dehydrogenase subunit 4 [Antodynerus aff. limbatus XZ]QKK69254.1 NADH dehydrogenase subunit 4 [Antodynerus aff. limbatus YN]